VKRKVVRQCGVFVPLWYFFLIFHVFSLGFDFIWDKFIVTSVGFEVLTAVVMTCSVFWDITPCNPLKVNLRLGRICRLYLQGRGTFYYYKAYQTTDAYCNESYFQFVVKYKMNRKNVSIRFYWDLYLGAYNNFVSICFFFILHLLSFRYFDRYKDCCIWQLAAAVDVLYGLHSPRRSSEQFVLYRPVLLTHEIIPTT
jgi:hypothetical protein